MSNDNEIEVEMPSDNCHPLIMGLIFNDKMQKHEIELMVGNYDSKQAAEKDAELIAEIILSELPRLKARRIIPVNPEIQKKAH